MKKDMKRANTETTEQSAGRKGKTAKKWRLRREDVERMLILCASALVVALALRQDSGTVLSAPAEPSAALQTPAAVAVKTDTQPTVVYYQDGEGYLVPVTRQVEKTDGIAKATLSLMVASAANDLAAARLGLKTTVPEGTKIDLDIADGKARVDLSKEALGCATAEQESIMVSSVAQTLCEFDSVSEVTFLFDGQKRSRLTHGTDVSGAFTGGQVNLESVETLADGARSVRLYFPSETGRMLVPVTRAVYSDADVTTAILEWVKGPKADSGLTAPVPKDCGILGVRMKDGVVTIDFTKQFLSAAESEGGVQALRAVMFTAAQFPGVKQVKITVEGQPYEPPAEAQSTFLNQESEIASYYPGVIEID